MANIFLGAAVTTTPTDPPVPSPWGKVAMVWEGWDGSKWNLTDPHGGTFLTKSGLRGLGMPQANRHVSESSAVAGEWYRGHQVTAREVFWPIYLYHDEGSEEWVERDRQFWRSMDYDQLGTWTVTQPNGVSRSLRLRLKDPGDDLITSDPIYTGHAAYGITLSADQPYWEGKPIARRWDADPEVEKDFLSQPDDVIFITSSHTMASAKVSNLGDVKTYPIWTVHGPCTDATVGVNGVIIHITQDLAEGEYLTIDTSPRVQTAVDQDGVNQTLNLGAESEFEEIPAGADVELSMSMTGSGAVEVYAPTLYRRAW